MSRIWSGVPTGPYQDVMYACATEKYGEQSSFQGLRYWSSTLCKQCIVRALYRPGIRNLPQTPGHALRTNVESSRPQESSRTPSRTFDQKRICIPTSNPAPSPPSWCVMADASIEDSLSPIPGPHASRVLLAIRTPNRHRYSCPGPPSSGAHFPGFH